MFNFLRRIFCTGCKHCLKSAGTSRERQCGTGIKGYSEALWDKSGVGLKSPYHHSIYEDYAILDGSKGGERMYYDALDLAKYIVTKCFNERKSITNLQLQKILYLIQEDFLVRTGEPAFLDKIEAWQFGPVIPVVYYNFSLNGGSQIWETYKQNFIFDKKDQQYIDLIVEEKREWKPWTLVNFVHRKDGAWDKIFKHGEGNRKEIPLDLIKKCGQNGR